LSRDEKDLKKQSMSQHNLNQGFPTFFAARSPLSGQSILSTPLKKFEIYIAL